MDISPIFSITVDSLKLYMKMCILLPWETMNVLWNSLGNLELTSSGRKWPSCNVREERFTSSLCMFLYFTQEPERVRQGSLEIIRAERDLMVHVLGSDSPILHPWGISPFPTAFHGEAFYSWPCGSNSEVVGVGPKRWYNNAIKVA